MQYGEMQKFTQNFKQHGSFNTTFRNDGSTFQSMLSLATFQIDRAAYEDGFFIVFLVTADDSLCGNKDPPKLNRKGITD